jgi:hypothetical protein
MNPCFLLPLLLPIVLVGPAQTSKQQTRVLVSTINVGDNSEATLDPVVVMSNGKFQAPYPESDEAAQTRFAKNYFAEGRQYRVTFGGGDAGTVTIKKSQIGCNSLHASGEAQANSKIRGRIMGLASNVNIPAGREIARRAPTDAERASAMELVKGIYLSRGTPNAWLKLLTTTNLTATDLDYDGKFELIGSFVIQTTANARRDLLVILEPQGDSFKPTLVAFQAYKLPPEQFDSAVDFVDQLDVDGDGIGEVFVVEHGFDAYGYAIYKKQNGRWRKVHSAIGDAC